MNAYAAQVEKQDEAKVEANLTDDVLLVDQIWLPLMLRADVS